MAGETKQEYVQVQQRPYSVPAHKYSKGTFVVLHDAVGPLHLGWTKGRVVTPDDLHQEGRPVTHLTEREFDRLLRLHAIRPATREEQHAAAEAKKRAEDADEPFEAHYVNVDEPAAEVAYTDPRDDVREGAAKE